ncbi:hypothetical protein BPAE_0302g00020 [Botrytis paeoniae]|uniref:Uncharacterized protein n=1 Tax=Botrytis paeoniae TaxID=278948 RepID=A0A4Z1FFI2_9HELO|nr:hypothetical protein BPAE_0302g00020 [Botrytis paeoniae]
MGVVAPLEHERIGGAIPDAQMPGTRKAPNSGKKLDLEVSGVDGVPKNKNTSICHALPRNLEAGTAENKCGATLEDRHLIGSY